MSRPTAVQALAATRHFPTTYINPRTVRAALSKAVGEGV